MRPRSLYLVASLLVPALLISLPGCNVSLPSDPGSFSPRGGGNAVSPTVFGVVTDASNSHPIQGAHVLIEDGPNAGSTTSTDADGGYRITVTRGIVTIRASHEEGSCEHS
jgi:hypothetical protein